MAKVIQIFWLRRKRNRSQAEKFIKAVVMLLVCLCITFVVACQDSVAVKIVSVYMFKGTDSVFVRYKDMDTGKLYASICPACPCEFKRGKIFIIDRKLLKL